MKTPMQELIERAITYSRGLSTEGHLSESMAVDYIIDVAESLLEKEKEVMSEIYADGGVCDVATFDDLMLEILDKHTISYERIINHIVKDL